MLRRVSHPSRFVLLAIVALFLLGTVAPSPAATAAGSGGVFQPFVHPIRPWPISRARVASGPPSYSDCLAFYGVPCYNPQEMQNAYNETAFLSAGSNGTGQTILIVDSYGSPTIQQDLATFDSGFGLPAPPSLQVIAPLGTVPWNPSDSTMVNWAYETTLDVEWAHAMAPGASIIVLTSPAAETEGVAGMPQFYAIEKYALDNHLGQIISQSWGATEGTFATRGGPAVIAAFESLYRQAAMQGVTVFASSGDGGVVNASNAAGTTFFPYPTINFPASSPWVTAVGGTTLNADASGNYQSETVWNDTVQYKSPAASGGGISRLFSQPSWQNGLPAGTRAYLRGRRGIPDISYDADPNTGVLIYESFDPAGAGWLPIGGTSAGSPQWAGLTAVANQLAGRPLGYLNPTLYNLGLATTNASAIHDITVGNNTSVDPTTGKTINGYPATAGWDAVTGWGSPNAGNLLPLLGPPSVSPERSSSR